MISNNNYHKEHSNVIDNGEEEGPEQPSIIKVASEDPRSRTTVRTKKNNVNVIRVGDRAYTEILVLPLEEANELLASTNDQFELIAIKVIVSKIIGHQFFGVLGKKESRPVQVPTPVQASTVQVITGGNEL